MAECSVADCSRNAKYKATGWCQTHYHRYWRTGSLDIGTKPMRTDLTYFGAHGRVKSTFGSATKYECVQCGSSADEWAYDGTDETELSGSVLAGNYPVTYSVWPEFYMPMCFPCHRTRDRVLWAARRTECPNGHEVTEENTYTRPSRPNSRECKLCKAESSRRRYLARRGIN